jgi:tRNA acetyltransferase TAN1|tara:strand:+ start:2916 stop:3401 length:486 start_codon:yes stop_codon:yes gene_type:complete
MEQQTIDEIRKVLNEFNDPNFKTFKTRYSGILKVETGLDLYELLEKIKEKIENEPWELRYCSRIIPIQKTCSTDLDLIKKNVIELIPSIRPNKTYRISIEKRDSSLIRNEIISNIASLLSNNVSLEKPDWEIIIQIIGDETGISVLPKNSILSINRIKRLD